MTRAANARLAGGAFLLYIVLGVGEMVVDRGSTAGEETAAKLTSFAAHAAQIRLDLVLSLLVCVTALTLAVALFAITRDEDHDIALLALVCRCLEGGALPVISLVATLGLLWLATSSDAAALDPGAVHPLAAFLLKVRGWIPLLGAIFFSVGSTLFSWLFLRGRMIPRSLAWLGVAASLLLVVGLPLQLVGLLRGSVTQVMWIPMAAFEVPLGIWLLTKGVAATPHERATPANLTADRRR
jgi:hypothetical protein